ncbi:hypothetical protein BOW53_07210 [Solemya pervernicosa gill symbiont]|uniref:Sensor protein FixL n=2 Tax=Gammaproteobacteria incertae sedis TaxID=118884 RepID=A0A1T2L651_9GAMM|nr:PAS domain S-box protein [Candidatus Reidiella endopervernicosa]OOZ40561.1 hypothetical protein BOW53_07210 [Solemya pervernicosa gill symbiont]QKQ27613.1 PAS domain S-box protein [Candidatus Reidiella endopervernicosa]
MNRTDRLQTLGLITLLVGGLLSLLLYTLLRQIEDDEIQLKLISQAEQRSAALAVEGEAIEEALHGLDGLYAASTHVGPNEFRTFLQVAFPRQTEIRNAVWIERVRGSEIESLYDKARGDNYRDYQIRELSAESGKLVKSDPRDENLIVYHAYNRETPWLPQGLNLSTLSTYQQLLTHTTAAKQIVSLLGDKRFSQQNNATMELFLPVFERPLQSDTGNDPPAQLRGFIGLRIDVASMVETAYQRHIPKSAGLDVYIVDVDPRRSAEILYFHPSRARSTPIPPMPVSQLNKGHLVSKNLPLADTVWRTVLRPIPGYFETGQSTTPLFALIVSLLFTLLAGGYLNSLQRRRVDIQQLVEQRTAELNASRETNRAVLETVVDGIITIDTKGAVQTFNPAAEKIFGYPAEEVIGNNINMLMPEPFHSAHDGYLENYLTSGEKKIIGIGREVTGQRKDGSAFPMELAVSEMVVHEQRMFTGIVRDITERKMLEQVKSEFVSTVSHELRTPLTSIRGALDLVLGKVADQLPAKARKMLEMANRNSERLTLLINDILDLEKIESGRLVFEFKAQDLIPLAQQAIEDNHGYANKHDVSLILTTSLTEAAIYGDEHRLLQVFANLISNAVKYSHPGGEVELVIEAGDSGYRIAVCDHGSGIPEAFRSTIFQRFAQADSSDTREKGGTGLGLSITKAIIERHGGSIDYESELGKGTRFFFDLSAMEAESESPQASEEAQVLICEDNADVATILAEMVETQGGKADIATTAAAARTLLNSHLYRFMLLDLTLPDADGLQLLQELRNNPETAELPIIVVSGRAEEGRAAFAGDAVTVVDWLQKPVDQARLEYAMRSALSHTVRPHILHIEDDPDIVQIVQTLLEEMADLSFASSVKEAREQLASHQFELVILDLGLADGSGVELLDELKGHAPVVIFSAQVPDDEITRQVGAALTKSMTSNEQLLTTINRMLKE